MSAHTPGPWSTKFEFGSTTVYGKCEPVANCFTAEDATLIAAAPELADACKKALSLIQDIWPVDYGNREVLATLQAMELALVKAGAL